MEKGGDWAKTGSFHHEPSIASTEAGPAPPVHHRAILVLAGPRLALRLDGQTGRSSVRVSLDPRGLLEPHRGNQATGHRRRTTHLLVVPISLPLTRLEEVLASWIQKNKLGFGLWIQELTITDDWVLERGWIQRSRDAE